MEAIFCIFSKYFLESVTIVNFWLPYWGEGGWGEFCLTSKTVQFHLYVASHVIERFLLTSRQPYWCTKPFFRELKSIFIQKSSFVLATNMATGHVSENALFSKTLCLVICVVI